jgi:uncharacterized protein with HEPN domain
MAEKARTLVAGRQRADLDADTTLQLALARAIEIVGEAASKVSPELRKALPSIPWRSIVSTRNRLIHAYFDIDLDFLWATATEEIPSLLSILRSIPSKEQD